MKHFTPSKTVPGTNNTIILTTEEWKNLLSYIRTLTESVNSLEKRLMLVEATNAKMQKQMQTIALALGEVYNET